MSETSRTAPARLTIGLVLNPRAGLGGRVALKGSDGEATVARALALGATSRVSERTRSALEPLVPLSEQLRFVTYPAEMGEDVVRSMGFEAEVVGRITPGRTSAEDTRAAIRDFEARSVDLILFAGGDGTARDICSVVSEKQPVLGIPAGVKMHSAVFAIDPRAAGLIVKLMAKGALVDIRRSEVRDIDEEAFRRGEVRASYYGEMLVPEEGRFLQHVKVGGREVEELVVEEIAAEIVENMEPDITYIVGAGTTTAAIMRALGIENTLLGFDVIRDGELLVADAGEAELLRVCDRYAKIRVILSIIGGQGHILGRGNQQLSPEVIRHVGIENLIVIATKSKLKALEGRPLLVDTGDPSLDRQFAGYIPVVTGYEDRVLYRVGVEET